MIRISSKKNKYTYNVYHIVKAFFPSEEIIQKVDEKQEPLVMLEMPGGSCFSIAPDDVETLLGENGERGGYATEEAWQQAVKKELTRQLYQYLSAHTGRELAWGTLTGVRPTKIAMKRLDAGMTGEEAAEDLQKEYFVTARKAKLACEVAEREKKLLSRLDCVNGFSLYVGIPFCPSVCSYCSFSSSPVEQWKDRIDVYLDALIKEIRALGSMTEGRKPDTVYIGGGTPTSLEPEQLKRLLEAIGGSFDLSGVLEYTVEAGRPDSITREKLSVIRSFPVTRISVNPQTMQQRTLDLVGRRHTAEQTAEAFHLARELGFDNINMDLIAGLPGETVEDMRDTLRKIEELGPDSLTVHALAIKRAAKFGQEGRTADLHAEISGMVEEAYAGARRMGLAPYYLYRQKNIAGNFENVGYAELDKAGIYNILIMEEKQTILAAGAGASTKVLLREPIRKEDGKEANLIRVENVKNIEEYIARIDEMIERKGEWLWR
ncbi:MAG TPA: coproporphyrinogen dehydrogenase HemZ [Candidatus Mediterraneibacter colneyensis]|nr:coproporphyrinogen dehydrogenase HemZ [Candidatus Mediterraneibacter colneyensis]